MVIIFFIMFLFIAATGISTGGKFLSRDRNSLSLEEEELDFFSQSLMVKILNTPIEGEKTSDLILKWWISKDEVLEEKIKSSIKEILDREDIGYIFRAGYVHGGYEDHLEVRNGIFDPIEIYESNLFLNGEKIKLELFIKNG